MIFLFAFASCRTQTKQNQANLVGGKCEGCEAILEYGDKKLMSTDTLPLFDKNEPKLKITGIVYEKDGKTPAEDVILYIYHTNREGIYQTRGDEEDWSRRHGFIRGWVKTGRDGKYAFYTFRPSAYPDRSEPEHIHLTAKEPDKNEYYLDSFMFDDDPGLSLQERRKAEDRGGSGIVKPGFKDGILTVQRDIILGKNIPDYN